MRWSQCTSHGVSVLESAPTNTKGCKQKDSRQKGEGRLRAYESMVWVEVCECDRDREIDSVCVKMRQSECMCENETK